MGCLRVRPYRKQLLFEMRRIRKALVKDGTLQRTSMKGVYTVRRTENVAGPGPAPAAATIPTWPPTIIRSAVPATATPGQATMEVDGGETLHFGCDAEREAKAHRRRLEWVLNIIYFSK